MSDKDTVIKKDIPSYFSRDIITVLNEAIALSNTVSRYGLPYSGGVYEQPAHMIDMLNLISECEESQSIKATHG